MGPDWTCDLAIAPQGALDRISGAINRRGRRALGILKTGNEYVGVVGDREFEIWERQKRAVHARGRVEARPRGTRVQVVFVTPVLTRAALAAFFILYAVVALGIATQPPERDVSVVELVIAAAGALALVLLFVVGARSQRSDLRSFLEQTFADVGRL